MSTLSEIQATTVALRERETLLEHRAALVARARREGYTWDEISHAMGVSRQAAKTAEQRYKRRSRAQ